MTLLRWLLGLSDDRWAEGGRLALRFATPPAPWIMLAGAVLAALLLHVLLRREALPPRWRHALYALRLGALLLVLFILGQPMIVLRRTHLDRSRVAVLVDRSASMAFRDELFDDPTHTVRRWDALLNTIADPATGWVGRLVQHHDVDVWTYADTAMPLMTVTPATPPDALQHKLGALEPTASRTNLALALDTVLEQMRGLPLAAVLVAGDGRETQSTPPDVALSKALARSASIHALGVGDAVPIHDVALVSAQCEEEVFIRDSVMILVTARLHGYSSLHGSVLQVRDKLTGELLASKTLTDEQSPDPTPPRRKRQRPASDDLVTPSAGTAPLREADILYRPASAGSRVLLVSLLPRDDEINPDNNAAELVVNARDDKIGVLFVEGSPRFEYRYLKNLLLREPGIDSSCLLLTATPGFPQEGTRPLRQFPRSVEELRPYDVIVFGDVDARGDWLSPMQQKLVSEHVMLGGAGIAFVAGQRHMPASLRQTPLEKLLPVRIDPLASTGETPWIAESFTPLLTAAGRRSGLFAVHEDTSDAQDWTGGAAAFFWAARVSAVQPAAEVLAMRPAESAGQEPMPLVVLGRVGAGRTFYLGSDDAWRLRQTAGEPAYEAFWLRVLRTLARGRTLGNDCGRRLIVESRNVELGRAVRVELFDESRSLGQENSNLSVAVTDAAKGFVGRIPLRPVAGVDHRFEGTFEPTRPGHYRLTAPAVETLAHCRPPMERITVFAPDRERREPLPDHEFLRTLAARTGGTFLRLGRAPEDWLSNLPDRSVQVPDDVEESLWDRPIILALFAPLVVTEWVIRKRIGRV